MSTTEILYQSILRDLSRLPADYLGEVEAFLHRIIQEIAAKEQNAQQMLSFAGAWGDMPDKDFEEYLQHARKTKEELFNRDIEL